MTEQRALSFSHRLEDALQRTGKALLVDAHMQEKVQAMEPYEAYLVFKELGLEDAVPLLQCATQEQIQTCIDLDCWEGDEPSVADLDAWLSPFAQAGKDVLAETFLQLESEIQVLHLAAMLNIYDVRNEEAPPEHDDMPRKTTQDGFFILEPKDHTIEYDVDPFYLVDALYLHDYHEAFRLLMAAKWELAGQLSEQALQFRTGRLADLGFPDRVEALTIFSAPGRPNQTPYRTVHHTQTPLPALYADPMRDQSRVFCRAANQITDPQAIATLTHALMTLCNHAVIAFVQHPGSFERMRQVMVRVRDTLNLGTEILLTSQGRMVTDDIAACAIVQSTPLFEIFRHGFAALKPLQQLAQKRMLEPSFITWFDGLETEQDDYSQSRSNRMFVKGLLASGVLWQGWDILRPEREKAFSTLRDLEDAKVRLENL